LTFSLPKQEGLQEKSWLQQILQTFLRPPFSGGFFCAKLRLSAPCFSQQFPLFQASGSSIAFSSRYFFHVVASLAKTAGRGKFWRFETMGYCDECQSAGSVNKYGFCEICGSRHLTARATEPVLYTELTKVAEAHRVLEVAVAG